MEPPRDQGEAGGASSSKFLFLPLSFFSSFTLHTKPRCDETPAPSCSQHSCTAHAGNNCPWWSSAKLQSDLTKKRWKRSYISTRCVSGSLQPQVQLQRGSEADVSLGWGCKPCDRGHVAPSPSSHTSLFSRTYYIGLDVALICSSSSRAARRPMV